MKPDFFDNTFANFVKRPQEESMWLHKPSLPAWAEILTGCVGSLCLCSDTLKGVGFLAKVLFKKPGF